MHRVPAAVAACCDRQAGTENFGALFGNLKGHLFEPMIARFLTARGYQVRLGWKVAGGSNGYGVDIFGERSGRGVIVERKGHRRDVPVTRAQLEKHFKERAPACRHILLGSR